MTEPKGIAGEGENRVPEDGEVVARLLRLAGPRADASPEAARRVKLAVHAHWQETLRARRRRRTIFRAGAALAAAASLVVAVSIAIRRDAGPPAPALSPVAGALILAAGSVSGPEGVPLGPGADLHAGSIVQTGPDARAAVRLAGGPIARLDRDTRVVLEGGSVVTLERGAIYVDTGPAGSRRGAVEVRTGAGLIREIGTRFEVRLRDGALRVRVRQGTVHLEREGRTHSVGAGGELAVEGSGEPREGAVPGHGPEWDWILAASPEFEMEGRTLGEFLEWVSTETGLDVRFSPEVDERRALGIVLHGSVTGLRPDQTPGAVLPTCGLRHETDGDTLTVLPADPAGSGGGPPN